MSDWTEERVNHLKKAWANGMTGGEIAEAMKMTRSAILGKICRLGLQRSADSEQQEKTQVQASEPQKSELKKPRMSGHRFFIAPSTRRPLKRRLGLQQAKTTSKPLGLDVLDLTNHTCKWPITEELPHKFCGHEKKIDVPYCEFHEGLKKSRARS